MSARIQLDEDFSDVALTRSCLVLSPPFRFFNRALGDDDQALGRLTPEDLSFLFTL